jgi:hypothetical protein
MGATNRGMSRGYCGPKVLTPADTHTQESVRVNRLRSNRSESLRQSGLSIGPRSMSLPDLGGVPSK